MRFAEVFFRLGTSLVAWMMLYAYIVWLAIFLVVKAMNSVKKKEEATPAKPPEPSKEEALLTEIRDALQSK